MNLLSCFPALVTVGRAVVYCCSAFWLFGFLETQQITGIRFLPFLAAGWLCWLLFRLFLRKPRPIPVLLIFGSCLWAAVSAFLLWKCTVLTGTISLLLSLAAVGAVIFRAAQVCITPLSAAQSISALERCTAFFIVFLWLQGAVGMPSGYSLPLLVATLLSLVAVLYQRLSTGQDDSSGRWMRGLAIATLLLLLIVGLLVWFFSYGSESLTRGVLLLFGGVKFVLGGLWKCLCAFLDWLASFTVGTESQPPLGMQAPPAFEALLETEAESTPAYLIAALIGGVLLVALVLRTLWMLRSVRLKGQPQPSKKGPASASRRGALRRWLRRICSRIIGRLRLRLAILSMRGTPQELYYFLTRAGNRLGLKKAPGETPAAFLGRAAALPSVQADAPLLEALTALNSALQQALYAPDAAPALPPHQIRYIRRRFTRTLWRVRFARLKTLPAQLRQKADAEKPTEKKPLPRGAKAQKNT